MGKHKNTTKSGGGAQRDASPTLLSHWGKPDDTPQYLIEEVSSQIGMSPKAPFRFTQLSRLPSVQSLSPEGRQACSTTPDSQMHYCIHIRVTLREGGDDQPPPYHAWSGLLIADMLQECLFQRSNHQSCGPCTRGSSLVLWKILTQRGVPL